MTATEDFLLVDPARHRLQPPESVAELGRVVVLAPHPDDESLGCGGLLALLAARAQPASVVMMTDGSLSHPNSALYPASRLAALREQETLQALAALGLPASAAHFLRFGDCALPTKDRPEFAAAVARLRAAINQNAPDTLFVPWRRDPHCDHEATWVLAQAAMSGQRSRPRWIEYPVWAWTSPAGDVAPSGAEASAWRLDISSVINRKQTAVAQHESQMGTVILDDPGGFVLESSMLAHFARLWELFLE